MQVLPDWVYPTITGVVWGVVTLIGWVVVNELLVEPYLAPKVRYRYRYLVDKFWKSIRDTPIDVQIIAKSSSIEDRKLSVDDAVALFRNSLKNLQDADATQEFEKVAVKIQYGKTEAIGSIELSYDEKMITEAYEIYLKAPCRYKKFSDHVRELSQSVREIEENLNRALGSPIKYSEQVTCELVKIVELTGILSDLKVEYMSLGNEIDVTFGKTSAAIAKVPYTIPALDQLKQLVTLYY